MTKQLHNLSKRIRLELQEIERLLDKITFAWEKTRAFQDELYLDSVALNLHGFYTGFERIFRLIATEIDGRLPPNDHWHKSIVEQMTLEMPPLRPAIFSKELLPALDEYRGFRHVVRNVYTFLFDMDKMQALVIRAPNLFSQLQKELLAFADFLETSS